jgi:hypothetical protein
MDWTAAGSNRKAAKSPASEKSENSRISRRDFGEKSCPWRVSDRHSVVGRLLQEHRKFEIEDFMTASANLSCCLASATAGILDSSFIIETFRLIIA